MTRNSVNLYTEFNVSDIIVASPLGLRLVIGADEHASKQNFDFLSSIEMLIVDQVREPRLNHCVSFFDSMPCLFVTG